MLHSFKGRIVLLVAGVALVAVALTTWAIAATTQDAIVDRIDEREAAESEITERLTFLALDIGDWRDAAEEVAELAAEFDTRIVLTDLDGRLLLESQPGDGPSLLEFQAGGGAPRLVAMIDPFGPLAEFGTALPGEDLDLVVADCLLARGVIFEIDEFGILVAGEADLVVVDECYSTAFETIGEIQNPMVAEPAWLFIDFGVDPPIPWAQLSIVAAVVVALALIAAAAASGFVAGPIRRLTEATRSIRTGDLGARVEPGSLEEVRELSDSFNEMAAELERAAGRRKQLTSDIAHELRSPVTNIIGHLDAVEDGVVAASPEHLAVVTAEAERLHHLIEDLGQLAQADEGQVRLNREEQDVGTIVAGVVEARRVTAADRSIEIRNDSSEVIAQVDASRVEQVVGNLLDNALQAVSADGVVTVAVGVQAGLVVITVSDSGPGIPEELLPTVFDRFRRGDKARTPGTGGRGLGLAIARSLTRAHGGDITASNRPDGGAEFVVTLPR